jgi:hypothetical protein
MRLMVGQGNSASHRSARNRRDFVAGECPDRFADCQMLF